MNEMRLVVTGAAGRMGAALIRTVQQSGQAVIVGALEQPGSPHLGHDAGELAGLKPIGVKISDDPLDAFVRAEGVLDFTVPDASCMFAAHAAQARIVHVIGTTGFAPDQDAAIKAAARHAAIIKSGNMSLGVNLLAGLVRQAAKALDDTFDIEIVEMHHRNKVDAPSGTALLLGEAAAQGRGIDLDKHAVRARDGHTGARRPGDIGFATLRGGSVVGDHSVILAGEGERIELTHRGEDRTIFARGALKAALWGRGRKPGLYSMADVLGLSEAS